LNPEEDPNSYAPPQRGSLRQERRTLKGRSGEGARRSEAPPTGAPRPSASAENSLAHRLFLNVAYVRAHNDLILGYIAASTCYGLTPILLTEQPTSNLRLIRLRELILSCDYSLHDLSYLKLERVNEWRVPRFNMPMELGMALALKPLETLWIFEAEPHRLWVSTSDVAGIDPRIHGGEAEGVFREFRKIFAYRDQVDPKTFRLVMASLRDYSRLMKNEGHDIWDGYAFPRLVAAGFAVLQENFNVS
jgi:hypothetical protein